MSLVQDDTFGIAEQHTGDSSDTGGRTQPGLRIDGQSKIDPRFRHFRHLRFRARRHSDDDQFITVFFLERV